MAAARNIEDDSLEMRLLTKPSFLTSPIVNIVVGEGENETVLGAHQYLLLESPLLKEFVDKFDSSGPVSLDFCAINHKKKAV